MGEKPTDNGNDARRRERGLRASMSGVFVDGKSCLCRCFCGCSRSSSRRKAKCCFGSVGMLLLGRREWEMGCKRKKSRRVMVRTNKREGGTGGGEEKECRLRSPKSQVFSAWAALGLTESEPVASGPALAGACSVLGHSDTATRLRTNTKRPTAAVSAGRRCSDLLVQNAFLSII